LRRADEEVIVVAARVVVVGAVTVVNVRTDPNPFPSVFSVTAQ
jgi:hypothetical protein